MPLSRAGSLLHVTMAINYCDYYEVFPASGANLFALVEDIRELVKREMVQVAR